MRRTIAGCDIVVYVSKRAEDFALAEVAALQNSAAIGATRFSDLTTKMRNMTKLELAGFN